MILNIFLCASWSSVYLFWRNILFQSYTHFLLDCLNFFDAELYELFVYFRNWPLVGCSVCKYFLPVHSLSFIVFMVSFAMQKLLGLIRSHLFVFTFASITLGDRSKTILLQFMSKSVLLIFSSRNFITSSLIFRGVWFAMVHVFNEWTTTTYI